MSELSLEAQAFEQHKQERLLQPTLFEQLEQALPFDNHVIWGHGTLTESTAASILERGIDGNPNYDLFSMATPLSDTEKSNSTNIRFIEELAQHWPHKNARYIVLLGVPFGIRPQNVVEHRVDEEKGERSSIPQRFILGYVDVEKKTFVRNHSFVKNAEPTKGLISPRLSIPARQNEHPDPVEPNTAKPQVLTEDDEVW